MIGVRRAMPEDVKALYDVNVRSIREICGKDYPSEHVDTWCANKQPENYMKWLADPKLRLFTGLLGGRIAGVALLDTNGWVFLLYVAPEAIGTGLGKALLQRLEAEARGLGLKTLQLKSTVTARAFYEGQGYTNFGLTHDDTPGYRMEKKLAAA